MSTTEFITFIKDNPKLTILGVIFLILCIYNDHVKEQMKHPEKKDVKRIPPLSISRLKDAHGIVFGKKRKKVYYSDADKEGHVFVCASSGAGKTSALAIPSIRSFCKTIKGDKAIPNTCFCIDISGDIEPNCNIPNKLVWDVEDPNSIPYNIFAPIDAEPDPQKQNELLQKLAFIIMPDCCVEGSTSKWFDDSGRNILTAALILYYHQGLDFVDICRKIKSLSAFDLFREITDSGKDEAIMYIAQFSGTNEANTAGCFQSTCDAIMLYATHPIMQQIIRRPKDGEQSLTPSLLETHSLFLKVPDADTDVYGPILGMITSQTFDYCARRENGKLPHILFVLDEYASLRIGKTAILNAIRKYRKKGIRICILTQAETDIDILYGQDIREAILANMKYKAVLGITNPDSQEYFSKIIGEKEYRTQSSSFSHNSTSMSYGTHKDRRIPPEAFGQLKDDLYVICDDGSYIKLQKNFYFK